MTRRSLSTLIGAILLVSGGSDMAARAGTSCANLAALTLPPNIRIMAPLGFYDFNQLLKQSYCVLSDSGTAAEEGLFYRVPNVSLRMATERMETLERLSRKREDLPHRSGRCGELLSFGQWCERGYGSSLRSPSMATSAGVRRNSSIRPRAIGSKSCGSKSSSAAGRARRWSRNRRWRSRCCRNRWAIWRPSRT